MKTLILLFAVFFLGGFAFVIGPALIGRLYYKERRKELGLDKKVKLISILLLSCLLMGCEEQKPNYDGEVAGYVAQWDAYARTNRLPNEHRLAVIEALRSYKKNPSRETAAELATLVRLYTTEPVP